MWLFFHHLPADGNKGNNDDTTTKGKIYSICQCVQILAPLPQQIPPTKINICLFIWGGSGWSQKEGSEEYEMYWGIYILKGQYMIFLQPNMISLQPNNMFLSLLKRLTVQDSISYPVIPFFAMAKIQRISHGHQAPFWHLVLLLGNQAVTRSENKLPHEKYTLEPQYFYKLWTPNKITTRGAD